MRFLIFMVLLALPVPGNAVSCTVPPGATEHARTLVIQINQERARHGLAQLKSSLELYRTAQTHACDNAWHNRLSHIGTDGSNFGQRVLRANYIYRFAGENVAIGYATPDAVLRAWLLSAGHRRNILSTYPEDIGIGVARGHDGRLHWVMLVGLR